MYGTYDRMPQAFLSEIGAADDTVGLPDIQAYNLTTGDISNCKPIDIVEPCTIARIGVLVTVATVVSTAPVIAVDRRVLYGSDVGRVVVDSITIPTATPAGSVVKADFDPVDLDVGDQLVAECLTQGVGSGGNYILFICLYHRAETTANQLEQSDSA